MRGRLQYRLKSKGWWGPMVGFQEVRWVCTVSYEEHDHPALFEAIVNATIPEGIDPSEYDDYMLNLAVECVNKWVTLPWDNIEVIDHETVGSAGRFRTTIEIYAYDMRGRRREVQKCTHHWTEKGAREIAKE